MRVVVLASSLYSETGCAVAVRLAQMGCVPSGALVLSTLQRGTLLRKLAQWGLRDVASYARGKLIQHQARGGQDLRNSYLQPLLKHERGVFRSLREVAAFYGFPVALCKNQNAPDSRIPPIQPNLRAL